MKLATKDSPARDALSLRITRFLPVDRETAFKAWVNVTDLQNWWGPRDEGTDFTTPHVECEARVGGQFRTCIRSPQGEDFWAQGTIRKIIWPTELEFSHAWESAIDQERVITVKLFPSESGGTRIEFEIAGFTSDEDRDTEIEGWNECLDRLVGYLKDQQRSTVAVEAEIMRLADEWSSALARRDLDALVADYHPDFVLFDLKPPYRLEGIPAYRKLWEECFSCLPPAFRSERKEVKIVHGSDVAVLHCLHRFAGQDPSHPACQTWVRASVVYKRHGGRWMVVHEHVSLPFDPMTGMVTIIPQQGPS
jgi:uncharacterized protein YndB with AHSA1/START domain/ketosteroid isomerase-like protein